ncbi:MAG TPA: alpha/beta hydrolase [Solirubrobacteraceae bacterium]|nr:alpha/beta hydrolase [Solirubrobacteraceae bacterium]
MAERSLIEGPGGRALEVETAGPTDGAVVLLQLGTPCAGRLSRAIVAAGEERGLRHVTYSRPGYARSTRVAGRGVSDCVADVAAVADALGVRKFYTVGLSGGGPHALATTAHLGDRVLAGAVMGSVAPQDAEGLDWSAGMAPENLAEFGAAREGEDALLAFLEREAQGMRGATADQLRDALGELISPPDRDAMTGEGAAFLVDCMQGALSTGVWGWFDDDVAFERDWGFSVSVIDRPFTVWHGEQDTFVPPSHGRWLAERIPGARLQLEEDDGHLSLLLGRYGDVLDSLLPEETERGAYF